MTEHRRLDVHVLCSSPALADGWHKRAADYSDIDIHTHVVAGTGLALTRELVARSAQPFVLCRDHVWFGAHLGRTARSLIVDLDASSPEWGLCSNRGARWDGRVVDFTYDAQQLGLMTALGPEPVLTVDDNLLLVNGPVIREAGAVPQGEWDSAAVSMTLSLECLRHGLPVFADPRLMTLRLTAQASTRPEHLATDGRFSSWYRESFVNHLLPTADGELDLTSVVDFSYTGETSSRTRRCDVVQLFDATLGKMRASRMPSLTLCCRSQFRRPDMLLRTLASFTAATVEIGQLARVESAVITDASGAAADAGFAEVAARAPISGLQCWRHEVRAGRFSRTDLLIGAIERAATDYIWFVDDDDFLMPGGAGPVARELLPARARIVIGNSLAFREQWSRTPSVEQTTSLTLVESAQEHQFFAADVYQAFSGVNQTPLCSMILPVAEARRRLAAVSALGDYNEDYFLLLLLLTSPRIEVSTVSANVAGISFRSGENTVGQTDRSHWHLSFATFMLELLNNPEGNSPLLWQLANCDR